MNSPERWKPIALPAGERFDVSDRGFVRERDSGRLVPGRVDITSGYRFVYLRGYGKFAVHLLVLLTFGGPSPPGTQARHLNDVALDNRFENLAWGTPKENGEDRRRNLRARAQARIDSRPWEELFFEAFSELGDVEAAAAAAGVDSLIVRHTMDCDRAFLRRIGRVFYARAQRLRRLGMWPPTREIGRANAAPTPGCRHVAAPG